jgi:hypothetical protein
MVFDGTQRSDLLTYTVTEGINQTNIYYFKLVALNYVGSSAFSPVLTSLAAVVPSTPVMFQVIDSGLASVTFKWEEPEQDGGSELLGYYIYYKRTGASTDWSLTELISDQYYEY